MTHIILIVVPKMKDAQHFNWTTHNISIVLPKMNSTNFTLSGHLFSLRVFLFVVQDHFIHMEISSLKDKGLQNLSIFSEHTCTAFEQAGIVFLLNLTWLRFLRFYPKICPTGSSTAPYNEQEVYVISIYSNLDSYTEESTYTVLE